MDLFLRDSCRTRIGADDILTRIDALMDMCLCPMRRPIAVFATFDNLLAGVCRQIEDHGPKHCKVPPAPAAIPVPT
ncbi:MAG: hypothetical protein GDA36_07495, partial [Rhodobacteraceae bacterium]|nr:hypothetical protein [Paracoccaceae bacterium]